MTYPTIRKTVHYEDEGHAWTDTWTQEGDTEQSYKARMKVARRGVTGSGPGWIELGGVGAVKSERIDWLARPLPTPAEGT